MNGELRYLLDTDTASNFLGRLPSFPQLKAAMDSQPDGAVGVSITVAEEMLKGQIKNTQQATRPAAMLKFYRFLQGTLSFLQDMEIVPFDQAAASEYEAFGGATGVGSWDRRNAAIAKAHGLIVVTANSRDYDRLPDVWHVNWCTAQETNS